MRTAESLFREHFLPLYPEDARGDLARARSTDANPAQNPHVVAQLADVARVFVEMAPTALGAPGLVLDYTDASVHRLSAVLGPETRERLVQTGAAGTSDNLLFNLVVHGAAYLGECILRQHGGTWSVRRPLWESVVHLVSRAGEGDLPVFHWFLKSLADPTPEGMHATLADRYRAHVEIPCARPEDLPVIAPTDRTFPKLTKLRYDVFYKYLKAHVPEIRDVGEAFPSPERFTDYELASLTFDLVGGGRMLVIHGPNKHGLHAFWLTKEGFEKSAFWPADSFPAPMLRVKRAPSDAEDEKLEVLLSRDGVQSSFELLWWGP